MTHGGAPDPTRQELADVLRETRELLARPDNDFIWSSWEDAGDALREIDGLIAAVEAGEAPDSVLFAPTGPVQEVSLSSGWGDEFLALADRWDAARAVAKLFRPILPCECTELGPPPGTFDEAFAGLDKTSGRFGEVSIRTCRKCGRRWLRYAVEYEGFTGSGRWYAGLLPEGIGATVRPEHAVSVIEQLPWHVCGGSYFDSAGRRGTGKLYVDLLG